MWRWLRKVPLKRKVLLLVLVTCAGALSFTAGTLFISDYLRFQRDFSADMVGRADMVALNSSAALAFADTRTANENLSVFSTRDDIVLAALYDRNGRLFTYYRRAQDATGAVDAGAPAWLFPSYLAQEQRLASAAFKTDYLQVLREVKTADDVIGYLLLHASLHSWQERQWISVQVLMVTLLCAFAIAALLSHRLQKYLTGPLLHLAGTMRQVSSAQDYSVRARRDSDDEIGDLIDGFNQMLTQIQSRDQELLRYRFSLEKLVEERTEGMQKARDEALRANQAKSVFLANMSHEIRTPMNAVLGYTQILRRDASLQAEQAQACQAIERAGLHLLDIINDILDLSKVEAGAQDLRKTVFDMDELIVGIDQMFSLRCLQKGLEWRLNSSLKPNSMVEGDQGKLRQILINLLGNAVKFCDHGFIALQVDMCEEQYRFSVHDSGPGIALEQQAFIFEPFHQGDSGHHKGGTGLGLALVKRHLELMGSTIELMSAPGRGSEFSFNLYLPTVQGGMGAGTGAAAALSLNKRADRALSLFVVDDVAGNRDVLSQLLQQVGLCTQSFASAPAALAALDGPLPDLIFMDIRMPGMDGFAALGQIRAHARWHSVLVVAITASSFERNAQDYLAAGFDGFVPKPFIFEDICQMLSELTGLRFIDVVDASGPQGELPANAKPLTTMPLADGAAAKTPTRLAPQLWQALFDAAEQADLTVLRQSLPKLQEFPAFAERWAQALARYDTEAMLALLAQSKPEPEAGPAAEAGAE